MNTVHCDLYIVVIVQWSVVVMLHGTGCQSSAWSVGIEVHGFRGYGVYPVVECAYSNKRKASKIIKYTSLHA